MLKLLGRRRLDLDALLPVGRCGWLVRAPGFTAAEVRRLLRAGAACERGRAVSRCLAHLDDWYPPAPDFVHCPHHYWERLPRLVFWYARGDSPAAIARRVSVFDSPDGVERALDTACRRIARCLNRQPDAYGYSRYRQQRDHPVA
jgi:hypothetical protein